MTTGRAARAAAAARIGTTLADYDRRRAAGQSWCVRCRTWHPVAAFTADASPKRRLRRTCNVGPWRTEGSAGA